MATLRSAGFLMVALAALGMCVPLGRTMADSRIATRAVVLDRGEELAWFPSGKFLREISMGHPQLLADLAWLQAVQYYGKHRLSDRQYPLFPHIFKTLIDADPHFEGAYLFAALVMAEGGYRREAERQLERGVASNPNSWSLQFELGFFQYIGLQDYARAAESFLKASRLAGAADYVERFAAAAYERSGDEETSAALWAVIAQTSANAEIRRMAQDRLDGLGESATTVAEN